jgi:hypothetical protein
MFSSLQIFFGSSLKEKPDNQLSQTFSVTIQSGLQSLVNVFFKNNSLLFAERKI